MGIVQGKGFREASLVGLGLCLLLLAGCIRYEVAVTINPDGSGSRSVALDLDGHLDQEGGLSLA